MSEVRDFGGVAVLVLAGEGPPVRDATDLVGEALGHGAEWVAVPVTRLDDVFFDLRTRALGDIVQKLVNYRIGLAVVGDVSAPVAASGALRDFVREANAGAHIRFVDDLDALWAHLG